MNRRLKRADKFTNSAMAMVSLCLTLIALEFSLRSVIPLNPENPAEFRIPDPVLGWVLEPNVNYRYTMPEATVSVTYNSDGFHDVEHSIEKPAGVFRILVLGDSFMEAEAVDLEDAFHRQVESLARATGRDVEVINLGVSGYGTLQEYLAYQTKGEQYAPDLVLLGFFDGNDLMNNSLELESILGADRVYTFARPFLDPSDPEHWTLTPVDFEGTQRRYAEVKASLDPKNFGLMDRFILLRLARTGLRNILNRAVPEIPESDTDLSAKERKDLAEAGANYCMEAPEYTRSWATTERIFTKLQAEVEAHGSKLIVFSVPSFEEVSLDYREEVLARVTNPDKLCLEDAPAQARLSQLLTKRNIDFIPLLPDFRRVAREDGVQLYRVGDLHWNPQGHALAAKLVVSELIERGLLTMPAP